MMSPENSRVESSGAEMSADNMSSHKMSPSKCCLEITRSDLSGFSKCWIFFRC